MVVVQILTCMLMSCHAHSDNIMDKNNSIVGSSKRRSTCKILKPITSPAAGWSRSIVIHAVITYFPIRVKAANLPNVTSTSA